jgi:CRISPR system Cascade subunit CasC
MMGTVEFNSACFYRYANIDLNQLQYNLGDDAELAGAALDAFLRASVTAVPTGKQNSMAAQNPPSFLLAVVRESGLWSLANAFLDPALPNERERKDLMDVSVDKLDRYWGDLNRMYGEDGIVGAWYVSLSKHDLENLNGHNAGNVSALIEHVIKHASFGSANAGGAA